MQGKKSNKRDNGGMDISAEVGFFYSPVNTKSRQHRRVSESARIRRTTPKFAQTNFRLILKGSCDGIEYISNPDKTVNWDDISSLECYVEEDDCCPICLMPAYVPRVARCGHIFCYPCILYYVRQQNSEWIKCPLCSELFESSTLRSVRLLRCRPSIAEGSQTIFDLVVRNRNSINAFPATCPRLNYYIQHSIPLADAPQEDVTFCHLLRYSMRYERNSLLQDINDLDTLTASVESVGEILLTGVISYVREIIECKIDLLHESVEDMPYESYDEKEFHSDETTQNDVLYYYSIPTRLTYHLHPLIFRCMRSQVSSFTDLSPHILSRVVEIDDVEVGSDDVSFKDPTLRHLPSHSVAHLVEVEVKSLLRGRLDSKLFAEVKSREMARKRMMRVMKREEEKIDRIVKDNEHAFLEQFAPYMFEEERSLDMMDSRSFPFLPTTPKSPTGKTTVHTVHSAWNSTKGGTIGINTTLMRGIESGKFPSLGGSKANSVVLPVQDKKIVDWGSISKAKPEEKPTKKEKKKPVQLFSF